MRLRMAAPPRPAVRAPSSAGELLRESVRVVEQESHDLVDALRAEGKDVDYLVFEDEGHDVLKLPNKIHCYETIVQFFGAHLAP